MACTFHWTFALTDQAQPGAGALDGLEGIYEAAVGAYALRRLFGEYEGPQIRVRRSSDDAVLDVLFDRDGAVQTPDFETWLGENTAFVVTWYDQSTKGKALEQANPSSQPTLVSDSVYTHVVRFQSSILQAPNLFDSDQVDDFHIFFLQRENVGNNNLFINFNGGTLGSPGRCSFHAPHSNRIWYWDPSDASTNRVQIGGGVTSVGQVSRAMAFKSNLLQQNGLRVNDTDTFFSSGFSGADVSGGLRIGTNTANHDMMELLVLDHYVDNSELQQNVYDVVGRAI